MSSLTSQEKNLLKKMGEVRELYNVVDPLFDGEREAVDRAIGELENLIQSRLFYRENPPVEPIVEHSVPESNLPSETPSSEPTERN